MKPYIRIIILSLLVLTSIDSNAQFGVGIRDNRYIYGDFCFLNHWVIKLEQSVYSEKIGYQYVRGYCGYKGQLQNFSYKVQAYFGSPYNRAYYSTGALVDGSYTLINRIKVNATLNPHYDSSAGYKTCFYVGAGVRIIKDIDILAGYTTIPTYREPEKRILAGFDFHIANMSVKPQISIAAGGNTKAKSLRPIVSFHYQF